MIEFHRVTRTYARNVAVDELTLTIPPGELFALLGPNGAGKSTLLKCIAGIFKPAAGSVRIMGDDTASIGAGNIARRIGYVPQQNETIFPFSVLEFVVMGRTPHISIFASPGEKDEKIAMESLAMVGIEDLAERTLGSLSGGQRQMALIARALAQQPTLLLLDEPTAHLDFGNQVLVLEVVQRLAASGISIVMNTHTPDHAFLVGSRAAALNEGRLLAADEVAAVVNSKMMSTVYGVNIAVREIEDLKRKVCIALLERFSIH
jgi:iron complex transport system ATP-binding protein